MLPRLLLALCLTTPLLAQMQMDVTIHGKPTFYGKDLTLTVDSHPQPISAVTPAAEIPLSLAVLIDTTPTQHRSVEEVRTATPPFLDHLLRPAPTPTAEPDTAAILEFSRPVELLADLTASRPQLNAAIRELALAPARQTATSVDPDNNEGRTARTVTALYDAIYLTAEDVLGKLTTRKAIIVITDGIDNGSKKTTAEAIESAQRAGITIFAIYIKGDQQRIDLGEPNRTGDPNNYPSQYPNQYPGQYPGQYPSQYPSQYPNPNDPNDPRNFPRPNTPGRTTGGNPHPIHVDGKKILDRITSETGGQLFEASKKIPIEEIYKQMAEILRTQYRISFTPLQSAATPGFHKLQITAPAQTLQLPDGYFIQ